MVKKNNKYYKQMRLDETASDKLRENEAGNDGEAVIEAAADTDKVPENTARIEEAPANGNERKASDQKKKRRNEKLVFSEFAEDEEAVVGYAPDEPEPGIDIKSVAASGSSSLEWREEPGEKKKPKVLPEKKPEKNAKLTLDGMPEKKKPVEAEPVPEKKAEKNAKLTLGELPQKKKPVEAEPVPEKKAEKNAKLMLGELPEKKKSAQTEPVPEKKPEKNAKLTFDGKKNKKRQNVSDVKHVEPANETEKTVEPTEKSGAPAEKTEAAAAAVKEPSESRFEIPIALDMPETTSESEPKEAERPAEETEATFDAAGETSPESVVAEEKPVTEAASDDVASEELALSIKAALAEKAATGSVSKKADKKTKAAKKAKNKAPEVKPLKPILSIANIMYSAIVFGAVTIAFLALPRSGVSATEQRELAQFPTLEDHEIMNGEYTNGITDYFNDNIPYRDELKKVAAQLRGLFGISYNDTEIIGPVAAITTEPEIVPPQTEPIPETTTAAVTENDVPAETTSATTEATQTTTPETTTKPVETTKNLNEIADGVVTNGQVVTKLSDGHWWGISLFGGGNGTIYANAVNRFKQELGDSVNVYSMPIPTAGEYYLPDAYAQYNASHQKSIDAINSQLNGVIPVPASMALWEHIDEPIYTRTDHHWQPLGAYYAAQCFAETAGVPFADISTMERVDVPGYMGTMYGFTESANLLSDPETFTYYKPTNSYKTYYYDTAYNYSMTFPFFIPMPVNGSYSTFMGADNKIVRIKTDAGTGRKLVVFKDSYGNAEIPFYFGSFDEIYVCDMRYFDLNGVQFVKFTGATDLLFTECTFSAVGTNANGLETILSNPETQITEGAGN